MELEIINEMHYIVQENIFRESNYQIILDALDRLSLPYSVVRIFPFVDKICLLSDIPESFSVDELPDYEPPSKNVFVFGAVKLGRISNKRGWIPGSMLNENHDFNVYGPRYGENLLNHDSMICTVGDSLAVKWHAGEEKFIRPCRDSKSFTGKLFTENQWFDLAGFHEIDKTEIFNEDTTIQIASPKDIQKEIRLWVVDGKVVTGSQYKLGTLILSDEKYEKDAEDFAEEMIKLFQPARAFVMDVCLTNGKWKIVEINCINASGFYKANAQKLLVALEDCFRENKD